MDPLGSASENIQKIIELFKKYYNLGEDIWIQVAANGEVLKEWGADNNNSFNRTSINEKGQIVTTDPNGEIVSQANGLTHPLSGKIIIATAVLSMQNYEAGFTVVHEIKHYMNCIVNMYQGNGIMRDLNEMSAYMEEKSWGGTISSVGQRYINNVFNFFMMIRQ